VGVKADAGGEKSTWASDGSLAGSALHHAGWPRGGRRARMSWQRPEGNFP
jgi:hypothetical protein